MSIMPTLGQKAAATVGTLYILCVAVVVGAIFGVFTKFLVNPVYHWITGAWVDSVVYELAVSVWAALFALGGFRACIKQNSVEGDSRLILCLTEVVDEFSSAFLLVGLFAALVALGGPFARLAAFFEVFTHGVTLRDALVMALALGACFPPSSFASSRISDAESGDDDGFRAYRRPRMAGAVEVGRSASHPSCPRLSRAPTSLQPCDARRRGWPGRARP
jgi:hypothetical protein